MSPGRRGEPLVRELWVSPVGLHALGARAQPLVMLGICTGLALAVGAALGLREDAPRAGLVSGVLAWIALWRGAIELARRWRPEGERHGVRVEPSGVSIEELGAIARDDVRACRFDPVHDVLWLEGPLGWPLLALETKIADAVRIRDTLGVADEGVRTFSATSLPAGVPYVGQVVVFVAVCASLFAPVMLFGGPLFIAVPALVVALPLATSFVPARIRVSDTEVTRVWLGVRHRVDLVEVSDATVVGDFLVLETRRGSVRWRLRFHAHVGRGALADWYYERWLARAEGTDRTIVAVVGSRSSRALASVFE